MKYLIKGEIKMKETKESCKKSCTYKGFTLIELLLVVLIIGILASIALPQYQKIIERSKSTQGLNLLKAVVQSMQLYYLTNNSYPTKFDQLDIEIHWNGKTPFLGFAKDTKSNENWTLELENSSGYVVLFLVRVTGKYKGAGFQVGFKGPYYSPTSPAFYCVERKSSTSMLFNLPAGAYCEKVIKGRFKKESPYTRFYTLPN